MNQSNHPVTRCKVKVWDVVRSGESENVTISAVYSDDPNSENKQWAKYTPCFELRMTIDNPGAQGKLIKGEEYFVDFIPVPKPATETQVVSKADVGTMPPGIV
jgi:hypothetical protein